MKRQSDLKESPSIDSDILIDMVYKQQELWSPALMEMKRTFSLKNWSQLEAEE